MQYILTEKEYRTLIEKANRKPKWLQKLCTKICDTMPVMWEGWSDPQPQPNPKPWGCIFTREKATKCEWYCDQCPVQEVCPYECKEYSK